MQSDATDSISQIRELSSNNQEEKLTFVKFLKTYPGLDQFSFLGYFTVIDIAALRLLCRDTAAIFNEDVQ
jgi:hypothetical protein